MSCMKDSIRALRDLGQQVRALRIASPMTTTEIARHSGRSRDVLNRLERGEDLSVSSLLAILYALGYGLELKAAGRPSLEEMRQRFARVDDADGDDGG
jgi:HTH-type transcriptional regulator / antitoxin HipB